jgi:hypothetical protein
MSIQLEPRASPPSICLASRVSYSWQARNLCHFFHFFLFLFISSLLSLFRLLRVVCRNSLTRHLAQEKNKNMNRRSLNKMIYGLNLCKQHNSNETKRNCFFPIAQWNNMPSTLRLPSRETSLSGRAVE